MNCKKSVLIFLFLILLNTVVAQEETLPIEEQTSAVDEIQSSNESNETEHILETAEEAEEILFINFIPKEFKLGDAQFSIQVQNNKNETIKNIIAFVSGKGFSTYEVTPVDSLEPKEKGYILINGNFKESGLVNLTVKINQKTFDQGVNVLGESEDDLKRAEVLLKQQEEKKKELAEISSKLETLKQNYSDLENKLAEKEKEGYEVKDANLGDLKKYLRETQASILGEHLEQARINLGLATEELNTAGNKIEALKKLPKIKRFREYAIIFSTLAGSIITFFALYELLKKKSSQVATTIGSIKEKTEDKEELRSQQQAEQQEIKKEEAEKEIAKEEVKEEKKEEKKKVKRKKIKKHK